MKNKLHNIDCLKLLKTLDDNSIDMILVDPPYFEIIKNKWDNQWTTEEEYLLWCKLWTEECFRVLKPNRCFYVWGTTKTDTFLKYKLNTLNNIDDAVYQNWIVWSYDWGGRTRKTFPRKHEDLLMYSKGKDFLFNADDIRVPYSMKKNVRADVWTKNNHTTSKEYVSWHPTQKPLELLERIIQANTNEGDIVLDCFSGSGSTMIAAEKTNRKFIGSEIDKSYCKKSIERMTKLITV